MTLGVHSDIRVSESESHDTPIPVASIWMKPRPPELLPLGDMRRNYVQHSMLRRVAIL